MSSASLILAAALPGMYRSTDAGAVVETPLRFGKAAASRSLAGEHEVFVTIRHVDDNTKSARSLLNERGFVALQPALDEDQEGQRQLEELLRARRAQEAVELLVSRLASQGSLGIHKFICRAPEVRSAAPGGTWGSGSKVQVGSDSEWPWYVWILIQVLPAAAQLLRLWLPIRSPVQPLAFMDARTWDPSHRLDFQTEPARHHPGQRWWYANATLGDVILLDALLTPRASFRLPGEIAFARLHAAARAFKGKISSGISPEQFKSACADLNETVFDPLPFPAVGERYRVLLEPSALLRNSESQESDVVGEIRPGGVVTVLELGKEDLGRAKVYTEQALVSRLGSQSEGPDMSSASRPVGGTTAWIRTKGYDGSRLLKPLRTPADGEPSDFMLQQIQSLSGLLRGVCGWVGLESIQRANAAQGSWNANRIHERNMEALEAQLEAGRHLSLDAECLALTVPPWDEAFRCLAAFLVTVLTAVSGSFVLRNGRSAWRSRRQHKTSSRPHFLPPPMS